MAKQTRYGKAKIYDTNGLEGKICEHRDKRIQYISTMDHNSKVVMHDDGELYMKLEDVEQLLIDNELLRQSLYVEDSNDYEYNRLQMDQICAEPTSIINKRVETTQMLTSNVLNKQDVYRFIYAIFGKFVKVGWQGRQQNESKMQFIWRLGYLPQIAIISQCILYLFQNINNTLDTAKRKPIYEAIKKSVSP